MVEKIRLLIASNESSTRRGLETIFSSEDVFDILGAYSIAELTDKAVLLQPDAVLYDVPEDMSGLVPSIGEIKSGCPCSLLLALVSDDQSDSLVELLNQGLDGCVPRGIMRGCLIKTVELACRASLLCLPISLKRIVSLCKQSSDIIHIPDYQPKKMKIPVNGEFLTQREMEILQLLAENYSNRQIAQQLFISEPTVKTHVSNILRKLDQNNRAQAIVYAFKIGLINDIEKAISK